MGYRISNSTQVLLYNFFKDSTASASQWRLVMRDSPDGVPVPDFDETKHAGICTEVLPSLYAHPTAAKLQEQLKFLYVAITRARKNLWFLDNSESAEPMKVPAPLTFFQRF